MAMHYYGKTLPAAATKFVCNGCGAVMVFYSSPSALFYGI
jgi:hypothetical protein